MKKKFKFVISDKLNKPLFTALTEELKEFTTMENGEIIYDEEDEKKLTGIFDKYYQKIKLNKMPQ